MSFPATATRGASSSWWWSNVQRTDDVAQNHRRHRKRHLYRNEARRRRRPPATRNVASSSSRGAEEGRSSDAKDDDAFSVCVLGCGPAGLTTALAIQKLVVPTKETRVVLFDKNPNAMDGNLGGGFNINGGAAVLEKLGVYDEVFSENANKLRGVLSRRCDKDRTRLFDVDVEEEVRSDFLLNAKELLVNKKSG